MKAEAIILASLMIMGSTQFASSSQSNAQLYFYARLSGFDERIPALYTSTFVFNLRTTEPANESLRIVLLFASPTNTSETLPLEYVSFRETDGTQFLVTNDTAFYNGEWKWHLFRCGGPFPWDSLCWYVLLGSTSPVTTAYQPQVYNTELVPTKWTISLPTLVHLEKPDNASLLEKGIQPKVFLDYLRPYRGYTNWYLAQMSFDRQDADKLRLGLLFWIPSGGLFGTLASASLIQYHARRRRIRFRLSLSQSLTLYLSSALFAFPFIISITQYAPPYAISEPEYLFYADAMLAFYLTIKAIYQEYIDARNHNSNPTPS